jgi:O-antigen ligase/polysaccharide polymerase Wzy-like membrane protein
VTAAAISVVRARPRSAERVTTGLLFASLFVSTFEKLQWSVIGAIGINDIATILFLIAFLATERERETPFPRTSAVVLAFFAAFALVYLAGFWDLQTQQGWTQFVKGMVKFAIHWSFMVAAVAYLWRRGAAFYWRALAWFTLGFVANAVYGILQLGAAVTGHNLDHLVIDPITGGQRSIDVFGTINGQSIYRVNALTGDPNHLGVMLVVPLLALTPVYLRLPRKHRLKWPLAGTLAFLLLVELATLSRSGWLGLGVGALVLALPYRRFLFSKQLLYPLGALALVLLAVLVTHRHFYSTLLGQRFSASGSSTQSHFAVYSFIGSVLHMHPLLGLGENNFAVYYEFLTGKTNYGAHSYWVSVIVESGLLGLLVWIVFLRYVFVRLLAARRLGRMLERLGDEEGSRVRPLAYGMTAALIGTIAANFFYLTMQFYYFYAFVAFVLALPVVFGSRAREAPG